MTTQEIVYIDKAGTFLRALLLATAVVTLSFWLQGNIAIGQADEGFLWYGTIQTGLGGIPIRDFQAYDPGRYYWGAAWSKLLSDDGLYSLRISCAAFQALGITFALLALRRIIDSRFALALAGVVLVLGLSRYHRVYEYSFSMMAVYVAMLLVEDRSPRRHFFSGVLIGLAAFFGRNLALYIFTTLFLLIACMEVHSFRQGASNRILHWLGGIVVGSAPLLIMLLAVPDFANSFLDSIVVLFDRRTTNIGLPIPWPWTEPRLGYSVGILYLIFPLFSLGTVIYVLLMGGRSIRGKEVTIASGFVCLTFMHYAFSRADMEHLSATLPPLIIGLISIRRSSIFVYRKHIDFLRVMVILIPVWVVIKYCPNYAKIDLKSSYSRTSIGGYMFLVPPSFSKSIEVVTYINKHFVAPEEGILFLPYGVIDYAIVKRKSPIWELFLLWAPKEARQQEIIRELREKNVNWIILGDNDPKTALDGREDLLFRNTHPTLWRHFMQDFDIVESYSGLSDGDMLMHRRGVAPRN